MFNSYRFMEGYDRMSLRWNGSGAVNVTGSVFSTCTANIVFTDDNVRAVYIDWDDGTNAEGVRSNDKEFANYQWKQITKPTGSIDVEHTYTSTGIFAPVIQIVNSTGIVSAYYGSDTTNTDVSPYYDNPTHQTFEVIDGTATGIMNVENKRVLSGIDNSMFEEYGSQAIAVQIAPLVSGADMTAYFPNPVLEVTALVENTMFKTSGNSDKYSTAAGAGVRVEKFYWTGSSIATQKGVDEDFSGKDPAVVKEVLKVKFVNPKYKPSSTERYDNYAANDAYKNLKIFILTKRTNTSGNIKWYPVAYVSAGSPIKESEDSRRFITMDFSQSRAKAANVTNSSYRFDLGKSWFSPAYEWSTENGYAGELRYFNFLTSTSTSNHKVSYSYNMVREDGLNGQSFIASAPYKAKAFNDDTTHTDWALSEEQRWRVNQFTLDDFGRFTDQYHLVRNSMVPSSQTTYPPTSAASSTVSSIINNKPDVFRITPVTTSGTLGTQQMTKLDYNLGAGAKNFTADYSTAAFQNGESQLVSLSGMNSGDFEFHNSSDSRGDNEYFIFLFDKPTNKVFMNISNFANNLIYNSLSGSSFDTPWSINGLSYLALENSGSIRQNAYWKSVPFDDTTKVSREYRDVTNKKYVEQSTALAQSGYLSFDMPLDWGKIQFEHLTGGQFATNTITSGTYDIKVTGTVSDPGDSNGELGNYLKLAMDDSGTLMSGTFGTPNEVGSFRLMAFITNTGSSSAADCLNRPLWVARPKGNYSNAAWDGADLYIYYGTDDTNYDPINLVGNTGVELTLRRINIYDVMTGCSKIYKATAEAGSANAHDYPPVDANHATAFPQTYCLSGASGGLTSFGDDVVSAWQGDSNSKYAMRISVSGGLVSGNANLFPNIWNVFDATESHVEIITEIDDTAYCLNSIPMTSDISITRAGTYYQSITRKGKVYISRTGDQIQSIGFSSVALGNERDSTAFTKQGPSTLYGNLHDIRRLQQNNVRVYWDEIQKDGTFVRFWGVIVSIQENHAVNGPQAVKSFACQMTVSDIALIDGNSNLMTDIFPLGGVESDETYS